MPGPQRRGGTARRCQRQQRPPRRPRPSRRWRPCREDRFRRARRRHQPRGQGRQGWSPLQLHRTCCGGRRRRHGRRRLRQGQGGAGRDRQGRRGGQEALLQGPPHPGHHPAPRAGREGGGRRAAEARLPGTGVIAGGPVRAVLECAGIHDVLSKSLGSSNAINIVHATVAALQALERPEEVAARRGLPLEHVAPAALLRARALGNS